MTNVRVVDFCCLELRLHRFLRDKDRQAELHEML